MLKQRVDCVETIGLLAKIIDSFHKSPGKGLPLGNVTSQIFANVYLNLFDWYVKKELGLKYYIRYCDDFVILSPNKFTLLHNIRYIECYLDEKLKLSLHPNKMLIRKLHQGIDFLGAVLLPHRIVVRTKTKKRIIKKSSKLLRELQVGKITKSKLNQSVSSYLGHLGHTKSRETKYLLNSIMVKMRNLP